ncbi:PKHD-type hydroxylase [Pseudidiomarina piscicola]|uniref:PKHD-type hydroxylase n=1 Tax=Pseudidiomarina piscicola TaxID=2614830 RepID=A0A6S6WKG7_9GAMM|nr:Fe2+-dependent dioxygenase [Pseudidiomarina piscicola]CAB0150217.1 PKHD-type hydroxylase [Pseudidiomarina piscicola]VZT39652.1 PKHD-type hydroxylase [Pseudomonas aeruginosa]
MILHIKQVIDTGTLSVIQDKLGSASFANGRESAGWAAQGVKDNEQLRAPHPLIELLLKRLQQHEMVQQAARPLQFVNTMINRYQPGQSYGTHMDDALMFARDSGVAISTRTDLSFTLGLTPLADYEGGELVIEDSSGERSWRIDAGDLLLYPSSFLHRVNPVSAGTRTAMVGWIESLLREPQQREICFDLFQSLQYEFNAHGKTSQFDQLSKTYNNLLRRWAKR